MKKSILALVISFSALTTAPGAISSPYVITADSIYKHISVLADDSLEGREVGEIGEWKAAQYIQRVFEASGLQPHGPQGEWLQPFEFTKRIDFGERNRLVVNGVDLQLHEDYTPLYQSASTVFSFDTAVFVGYGIKVPHDQGTHNDYSGFDVKGKTVIVKRFAPPPQTNPHIDFDKYSSLTDKINAAVNEGAAAVIFVTPVDKDDKLKAPGPGNVHPKSIPIVHLRHRGLKRLGLDLAQPEIESINGETDLIKVRDTGYNVIGFLPATSDTTVIIGAHYDHLGWGTYASLYDGEEKMIHNGADDNASGVAALLELARYYSSVRESFRYSLLFIAFSGEEAGVLGSSYFSNNMTIDPGKARMMANLDMIGRMKEQEKGLAVMGTGTCVEFKDYFDSLHYDDLRLALKESGAGPSDHAPFYNRGIPSFTFFTGPHADYHKPSDDIDKIDPQGIVRVTGVLRDVIDYFDDIDGALTFQQTKDPGEGKRRSQFSVSLGIMPDYITEVEGLRVEGVMPERPGEKAGILKGDVIVQMGDIAVKDIYDYMNALGKFQKGDSIKVVVDRDSDTLTLDVVF